MAYYIDGVKYTKEEYYKMFPEIKAHAATVQEYVAKIKNGEISIVEVPTEYYQEVYNIINLPEPEPAEQTYTLDEAAAILASEVNE